jgi:uncharacterized phage protein (TIGR02218 family)
MTTDQITALQKGTSSICMLAKLTAAADKGGFVIRIALNTRKITFEGEDYNPFPVEASEQEITAGTSVDNATFQTMLSDALNRLNLRGGIWQGAKVEIIKVDYLNLGIGAIERYRGRFGEATINGRQVSLEYQSLTRLLSQEIGDKTSHLCRYQLGVYDYKNNFCPVNLASFTQTGSVTAKTNDQKFTISISMADGYYYRGKIKWTSGSNNGLSMETQNNVGNVLTLLQPMYKTVQIGDTFQLIAGDDKKLSTCHNKFNAAIDFGGETEEMPTRDDLFKFPD